MVCACVNFYRLVPAHRPTQTYFSPSPFMLVAALCARCRSRRAGGIRSQCALKNKARRAVPVSQSLQLACSGSNARPYAASIAVASSRDGPLAAIACIALAGTGVCSRRPA